MQHNLKKINFVDKIFNFNTNQYKDKYISINGFLTKNIHLINNLKYIEYEQVLSNIILSIITNNINHNFLSDNISLLNFLHGPIFNNTFQESDEEMVNYLVMNFP